MKRITLGMLAVCLIAGLSYGQGERTLIPREKKTLTVNCTATGIFDTTIIIQAPELTFFGDLQMVFAIEATTDFSDSLRVRARWGYGNTTVKAFTSFDGDTMDWYLAKMWGGGTTWENFDWGSDIDDEDRYLVSVEQGMASCANSLILNIQHYDKSDSTSVGEIEIDSYNF